ncbi:beta-galactosidase [soil metagenome]
MPETSYLNPKHPALWHGGDYNPEQWPREVWDEDMRLMRLARFDVATIGVFSWVTLEPSEGVYEFGWLDELIAKLTEADRWFILATPSAAAPAWLSQKYPETLRTGPDRVRHLHGNRVNYSLGSQVYRDKVQGIARKLAERYGAHPRLLAWHVSNEYGGVPDYSAESVAAFRLWLQNRYGTLDALNAAYWTAFWSHTYTDWGQIEPPGEPYGETAIQGLTVDWRRFVTDQTVEFMLHEAAPLREISPAVPITTNLMSTHNGLNYRKFAEHLDFVSWDSYPGIQEGPATPETWIRTSFNHDLMRSIKLGAPWMLMECTPGASNWQPSMHLKAPGVHRLEALQAVVHGADGVQYFQWRQSRGSQEQFHAAVVSHAGAERTRTFNEVREVGEELASLADVAGSKVEAEVALVFDWEARWALDAACGPVQRDKGYAHTAVEHYGAFWQDGIAVDIVGMDDPLEKYKFVVAPMAYSLRPGFIERVRSFVEKGGTFLTTYLSGWTDENSLVFEGGYLAPWSDLLGIWSEELDVLSPGETLCIEREVSGKEHRLCEARDFCELVHATTAEVHAVYGGKFYEGRPVLTTNHFGAGKAHYVAARLNAAFLGDYLPMIARQAGVKRAVEADLPPGVTAQKRGKHLFLLNARAEPARVGKIELKPYDVQRVPCG